MMVVGDHGFARLRRKNVTLLVILVQRREGDGFVF